MATINLKVLLSHNDEKIVLDNIDLNNNVKFLKDITCKRMNCSEQEFDLIYLGSVLDDNTVLNDLNLTQWSFINILLKDKENSPKELEPFSEEDLAQIAKSFSELNNSALRKIAKPEALQKILNEFPDFRKDIVAYIILTEPILLSSLQHLDTLKKLNEHHRILLSASKLILSTIQEMSTPRTLQPSIQQDELSDSSSSSSENIGPAPASAGTPTITRERLFEALRYVVSQTQNNLNARSRPQNENLPSPSTSGRQNNVRITPSMFANALNHAFNPSRTESEPRPATTPTLNTPIITAQLDNTYSNELQLMREMGLYNENLNMQALLLCNGNVDAAINLIFSGAIN